MLCVVLQGAGTHSVSAERRDVVIVGGVSELDSVLTGFGLTAQGALSIRDTNIRFQQKKVNQPANPRQTFEKDFEERGRQKEERLNLMAEINLESRKGS